MPKEIDDEGEPGLLPTGGVVKSLSMAVRKLPDGRWQIRSAWLDGPVTADTWPEAYWAALSVRPKP